MTETILSIFLWLGCIALLAMFLLSICDAMEKHEKTFIKEDDK